MTIPNKDKSNQEICSIRIMFPVESDEQAIDYKKRIAEVLKDVPEATTQFSLISGQPALPVR